MSKEGSHYLLRSPTSLRSRSKIFNRLHWNDGTLILLDPIKSQSLRKSFQFNKFFGPNATQEEMYNETWSLGKSVMDGYNVMHFCLCQTGSGKTYSVCGPAIGSAKDVGFNSKALNDLFQISCTREDIKYEIHVQMVEIYNEQVRDLSEEASTTKLEIRNCLNNGGLSLPDATMHHVQPTSHIMNLMKVCERNRAFSSTAMNNKSSQSHRTMKNRWIEVHSIEVGDISKEKVLWVLVSK